VRREDVIAIVKEELNIATARDRFAQILKSPFSRRMFSHVAVDDLSGSDLKYDKYIKDVEACCDYYKEIAGYDVMGMIAEKCGPPLVL
jgi:hypothetical protein